MAGTGKVCRRHGRVNGDPYGVRPIVSRDACGDAFPRFNALGKGGPKPRGILRLKLRTVLFSTVTALLSAVYAITLYAQAPAQPPVGAPAERHHEHEAPMNLQVLLTSMTGEQVHDLMDRARAGEELTVDLEARTAGGHPFELDDFSRECLLEGLDEIGLTLREEAAIAAYEQSHA